MTPENALAALADRHGVELTDGGKCPGGEVGARYATGAGGEQYVYKVLEGPPDMGWADALVERVNLLRARGYPAPRYLEPLDLGDVLVLVQERVAGTWSDQVDDVFVGRIRTVNDLQEGLGSSGTSWSDYVAMTMVEGADGHCVHETLRSAGGEMAQILDRVESWGRELGPTAQNDLVHLDFHHRNVLRADGGVLTVIDLEGLQPGDRAFDLITFCIGMSHAEGPLGVELPLWRRAAEITSAMALAAYVGHNALRRLDWSLRFHGASEVNRLLPVVRRYMKLAERI